MGYQKRRVVVTGGLGFIGSNLAVKLAQLGANVTVVDNSTPGCGANTHNLDPMAGRIRVLPLDIASAALEREIGESDLIFNLAGEVSHTHSMRYPERDLQINVIAQLRFLQLCARRAPGVRCVYANTRQVYGVAEYLPLDETHPVRPTDFNGAHKQTTAMYHLLLQSSGAINAVVMNMTNIYGPRMALNIPCQGVLSAFVRRCLLGERLEVYGDGSQLRDPLHVDDAVEALLAVGAASRLCSHLYSLGGPEPLRLLQIAAIAAGTTGGEKPVCIAFPLERKLIDIGSTYSSSKRIGRELGWKPRVCFPEGFSSTINFYRSRMEHYLSGTPHCPLCDRRGEEAQASVNGGFPARTSAAVRALA